MYAGSRLVFGLTLYVSGVTATFPFKASVYVCVCRVVAMNE